MSYLQESTASSYRQNAAMQFFPESQEIQIESRVSVEEAVQRLTQQISSSVWRTLVRSAFVGRAAGGRVTIARYRPGSRRMLSPQFVGKFFTCGGRVVLVGRFQRSRAEEIYR